MVRSIQRILAGPLIGVMLALSIVQIACHTPLSIAATSWTDATHKHYEADCLIAEQAAKCHSEACATHVSESESHCLSNLTLAAVDAIPASQGKTFPDDDPSTLEPTGDPVLGASFLPRLASAVLHLDKTASPVRQPPNTFIFNFVSRHNALCLFAE